MKTRGEIAKAAREQVGDNNKVGTCQYWVRTTMGASSVGDYDGDGRADAEDGWKSEPTSAKHPGDRNPPAGVPGSWTGGSHDDGHRAISDGDGYFISTDAPVEGKIGRVHVDWFERNWGLKYEGWSDTISGERIPEDNPVVNKPKEPRKGSDAAKALANLRSALRRAQANGYSERARELRKAINEILTAPTKR